MAKLKAWRIQDEYSYEGGCTVVFAETRGKAHAIAMGTECCEDAEWTDIRVTRLPLMDGKDRGRHEINWDDPEDRIALVRDCGWSCSEEYLDREHDCPNCPAAEWCGSYIDWKKEFQGKDST